MAGNLFELELEGLSQEDREFEAAKQFVRFADAGHNDLDHDGSTQTVREFLAKTFGEAKAASEPARKVR